ncbi:FlgB family protein [Roseobacteraceae bacterium S113]
MFQNLTLFQMSHSMARHAGQRQALVAQNMANSDTPGFRPRDLTPFAETVRTSSGLVATRDNHLHGGGLGPGRAQVITDDTQSSSPNGNSVSVEQEMLRAVEVKRQHDRALAIYRHSMTVLRASIGSR